MKRLHSITPEITYPKLSEGMIYGIASFWSMWKERYQLYMNRSSQEVWYQIPDKELSSESWQPLDRDVIEWYDKVSRDTEAEYILDTYGPMEDFRWDMITIGDETYARDY